MEEVSKSSPVLVKATIVIPDDFYSLMMQRKHIEFERADLQNNLIKLEYFYTNHRAFCDYHMKVTEGIYDWTNYNAFINSIL